MKKLALIVLVHLASLAVYAQCTPDLALTEPSFVPANLPDGVAEQSYSEVIQFKVLTDTIVFGQSATVNQAVVTNVSGLPSGFTYTCNKANCTYAGGENGCVTINGSPTLAQKGVYDITISVSFSGELDATNTPVNMPIDLTGFTLQIHGLNSIADYDSDKVNHSISENNLNIEMPKGSGKVEIFDLLGKKVQTSLFDTSDNGKLAVDLSGIGSGVFLVSVVIDGLPYSFKISKSSSL